MLEPEQKLAVKRFGTGATPSPYDPRNYEFHPRLRGVTQPFDWDLGFDIELVHAFRLRCADEKEFFGKYGREGWGLQRYKEIYDYCKKNGIQPLHIAAYDQNGSGSCTGQGLAKYLTVVDLIETGKWDDASAKDIYSWIAHGFGQGSTLIEALQRAFKIGVAKESLVPSYKFINGVKTAPDESFIFEKPQVTEIIEKQRNSLKTKSYAQIKDDGDFMDNIAWAMLLNFGAYIGVGGDDAGDWLSAFPKLKEYKWGHALYLGKAGLKNNKRHLGDQNSWGEGVGELGWQWLNEDWTRLQAAEPPFSGWRGIFEAWTIQDKSNLDTSMQTNSKIIKVVYPDGRAEIGTWDPATNPAGFISQTRNRAMEIPLKPDQYGNKDNDVQWDKVKLDGVVYVSGQAAHAIDDLAEPRTAGEVESETNSIN